MKHNGQRGLHQQWHDFREYFSDWKHAKVLFGVSAAWFLLSVRPTSFSLSFSSSPVLTRTHSDIAFYGVNLNQSIVLSKIGFGSADTPWGTLWNTAVGNIIVSSAVS